MTSLEGCSSICRCLQISRFHGFYEGTNSNRSGIRQEEDKVDCSEKVIGDARWAPEMENLAPDEIFVTHGKFHFFKKKIENI